MRAGARPDPLRLGRYAVYEAIASGGMATVYFGRLLGEGGFTRSVAIKRLHAHLAQNPEFSSMLLEEARLAGRIRHPNVVSALDVVALEGELFLVMEYVHGESVASLARAAAADGTRIPVGVTASIVSALLHGLHAAHEATGDHGRPLHLVHRDVSPQNVLVGIDGIARVLDFGIAKARDSAETTTDGRVKGKYAYMAPEQLQGQPIDRRTDVYSAGVVLWEMLTGQRLFVGETEGETMKNTLFPKVESPCTVVPGLPPELEEITLRALSRDPSARFDNARQMATAIEKCVALATSTEVGEWVDAMAGPTLERRAETLRAMEMSAEGAAPAPAVASPGPRVSRAARTIPFLVGAAALTIALGAAAVLARTKGEAAGGDRTKTGEAQDASSTPLATATVASVSPSPEAPAIVVQSSAGPRPTGGLPGRLRPPAPRAEPRGTGARAVRAASCNPPYTLDADGVRRYKPECPLE